MHPGPDRCGHGLDAARGQVVLFGGESGGDLRDTWTWDGTDWTKRTPQHAPPARAFMGMAYDAARGQVVMFGGETTSGRPGRHLDLGRRRLDETLPRARAFCAKLTSMAYDAAHGQVVLFGGYFNDGDTWTWDGSDWTERTPAHAPEARDGAAMAYDTARSQIVLFGGSGGGERRTPGRGTAPIGR